MKNVTAKELQVNSTAIIKGLREGQEYQITFHRRPIGKLSPIRKPGSKKYRRGSYEAVLESLKFARPVSGDLGNLNYKELRARMIEEKYGK